MQLGSQYQRHRPWATRIGTKSGPRLRACPPVATPAPDVVAECVLTAEIRLRIRPDGAPISQVAPLGNVGPPRAPHPRRRQAPRPPAAPVLPHARRCALRRGLPLPRRALLPPTAPAPPVPQPPPCCTASHFLMGAAAVPQSAAHVCPPRVALRSRHVSLYVHATCLAVSGVQVHMC